MARPIQRQIECRVLVTERGGTLELVARDRRHAGQSGTAATIRVPVPRIS